MVPPFIEYIVANLLYIVMLLLCYALVAAIWVVPFVIYFYVLVQAPH